MRHTATVSGPVRTKAHIRSRTYHLSGESQENWSQQTVIRLLLEVASFTRIGRVSSCRLDGQWMNARASVELAEERAFNLQHQRVRVEASLASSDTLIPSTCKDADGTQELKLKIYEVRPHGWHKLAKLWP